MDEGLSKVDGINGRLMSLGWEGALLNESSFNLILYIHESDEAALVMEAYGFGKIPEGEIGNEDRK